MIKQSFHGHLLLSARCCLERVLLDAIEHLDASSGHIASGNTRVIQEARVAHSQGGAQLIGQGTHGRTCGAEVGARLHGLLVLIGVDVLQEVLPLFLLEFFSELLDCVRASKGEVLISFDLLGLILLSLPLEVVKSLDKVLLNKVGLHESLYLLLLSMIFLELLVHELGELLLLLDLDGTVEGVHIALHSDLLHVQVEHLLVRHVVVPHVNSLAEFAFNVGGVDEGKACSGGGVASTVGGSRIALVSNALKLILALLRIRIRRVHVSTARRRGPSNRLHAHGGSTE